MLNVPHLFDILAALVSLAGNGLTFWLVKRLVDDRVTGIHESFADAERHIEEVSSSLHSDFQSHIDTAKDQLAGMSRRVCHVCKLMHTRFEVTPQGAICEGCKLKAKI